MANAQNNTRAAYYKAEHAARVAKDHQAAWSVPDAPCAAAHAAANAYLSKTAAWNIGGPTLATRLAQRKAIRAIFG